MGTNQTSGNHCSLDRLCQPLVKKCRFRVFTLYLTVYLSWWLKSPIVKSQSCVLQGYSPQRKKKRCVLMNFRLTIPKNHRSNITYGIFTIYAVYNIPVRATKFTEPPSPISTRSHFILFAADYAEWLVRKTLVKHLLKVHFEFQEFTHILAC